MKKIDIIAGARPNFMKIGPIIHALKSHNDNNLHEEIEYRLIHTGQHYDKKMSQDFFDQLNIPHPDINLEVGSGTQAYQTGQIMLRYEQAIKEWKPELCIVVGDVTSTLACAITAKKEWIKVAHVEGGIRSGDDRMPEEINRKATDSITDYFFTTTSLANDNLYKLGHDENKVFFVGNTMIDSLLENIDRFTAPSFYAENNLQQGNYIIMTLHRPSNVDGYEKLRTLLSLINDHVDGKRVIFPMHPRTKKIYDQLNMTFDNLIVTGPMPYLQFNYLVKNALGVITDSGGITEETTVMGVPCMTLRDSTERPETVTIGTNVIVGTDPKNIVPYLKKMISGKWKSGKIPELWDGKTADRIVSILSKL